MIVPVLVCALLFGSVFPFAWAENDPAEALVGSVTETGYENRYFYFKITLPDAFQPDSRAADVTGEKSALDASNRQSVMESLYAQIQAGGAVVYSAGTEESFLSVTVYTPAKGTESFGTEKVLAENSEEILREDLKALGTEDFPVTDIQTKIWYYTDFLGTKHYSVQYSCNANGVPFYGANVYVRSKDAKYLAVFDFSSFDPDGVDALCALCSKL